MVSLVTKPYNSILWFTWAVRCALLAGDPKRTNRLEGYVQCAVSDWSVQQRSLLVGNALSRYEVLFAWDFTDRVRTFGTAHGRDIEPFFVVVFFSLSDFSGCFLLYWLM